MVDTALYLSLEVALRALNAVCLYHQLPEPKDEARLREITGDTSSPIDELACRVIQSELQSLRKARTIRVQAA